MSMNRRQFLHAALAASLAPARGFAQAARPPKILLRSSWQTVNIGDIAHTPGMLALLEKHRPGAEITLWPSSVDRGVEEILRARFPKLRIAKSKAEQEGALAACDFFLHGSGPGLVGRKEVALAQQAGKPYGFAGVTNNEHSRFGRSAESKVLMHAGFESAVSCKTYLNTLAVLHWLGAHRRLENGPAWLKKPLELFDMKTDSVEKHDAASEHPDVVRRFTDYFKTARIDSENFPVRESARKNAAGDGTQKPDEPK